jgi:hypothetical protein
MCEQGVGSREGKDEKKKDYLIHVKPSASNSLSLCYFKQDSKNYCVTLECFEILP